MFFTLYIEQSCTRLSAYNLYPCKLLKDKLFYRVFFLKTNQIRIEVGKSMDYKTFNNPLQK